jgi:hypothetical protein
MKIRTKYRLLILLWFVCGSILILSTIYVSGNFLILLIFFQLLVGVYSMLLRCPNCGKPVLMKGEKWPYSYWTIWIPENCTKCREKIN